MIQNHRPLIDAVITAFLFLDSSGDNEVNPDSAVRCMESMSASLLALDELDQIALRSEFLKVAADSKDDNYQKLVRELPDMIGLAS